METVMAVLRPAAAHGETDAAAHGAMRAATPNTSRRFRAIALAAVLLLHVALVAWLQHAWHRGEAHSTQRRSSIRMVTIQLPPLALRPPAKAATQRAEGNTAARSATAAHAPTSDAAKAPQSHAASPRAASPAPGLERVDEAPRTTVVIAAPTPASGASGPSGRELMDGTATRRAIRQSAQGQPLLAERADEASRAPDRIDASTKLGNEMMKGASGDCLKGEYAGGGMGLLSAPFWLLAEARGKCRR